MKLAANGLAVEIEGTGPAVLMIHGLGGTANFYQVQAEALVRDYSVIRVDLAGAGRSPATENITIDSHADDLAAVIRESGHDKVVVVGHSMGTLIARSLAARHTGSVGGLVLLGAVARLTSRAQLALRERAAILRTEGTVAVASGIVASALSAETRASRPEVAAFVRELVMRQDAEGFARNCEALATSGEPYPISPDIPLRLIAGSEDKVAPPQVSRDLRDAHPSARVTVIDGIGHWIALEAASTVTSELRNFLQQ